MNIVLLTPEMPANTGNIGRSCVAVGAKLHLIGPLGFHLNERNLRRAGLDYWQDLDVTVYDSLADFFGKNPGVEERIFLSTTKAEQLYTDVSYPADAWIMFGPESAGIPEELLVAHRANCIRIPMLRERRSLNLSNAAAIVLYEALRQNGFPGLEAKGELHRLEWD